MGFHCFLSVNSTLLSLLLPCSDIVPSRLKWTDQHLPIIYRIELYIFLQSQLLLVYTKEEMPVQTACSKKELDLLLQQLEEFVIIVITAYLSLFSFHPY